MGNEALGLNERREEIDSFPFSLEEDSEKGLIHAKWQSPDGPLELTASTRIQSRALQDAAFDGRIDGQPVPLVRLA
jgi:hypothetical protein